MAGRWWWRWTGPSSGTIPTSTTSSSPELLRYFLVPLQYHLPLLVCPTNKCKLDRLSPFLAPTALCIPWSAATVCLFTHLLSICSINANDPNSCNSTQFISLELAQLCKTFWIKPTFLDVFVFHQSAWYSQFFKVCLQKQTLKCISKPTCPTLKKSNCIFLSADGKQLQVWSDPLRGWIRWCGPPVKI